MTLPRIAHAVGANHPLRKEAGFSVVKNDTHVLVSHPANGSTLKESREKLISVLRTKLKDIVQHITVAADVNGDRHVFQLTYLAPKSNLRPEKKMARNRSRFTPPPVYPPQFTGTKPVADLLARKQKKPDRSPRR